MLHEVVIGTPGVMLTNLLRAKFFRGNESIYLHFMSFLHIDMAQVVEIVPPVRQELTYFKSAPKIFTMFQIN